MDGWMDVLLSIEPIHTNCVPPPVISEGAQAVGNHCYSMDLKYNTDMVLHVDSTLEVH
jgi:hypothetical protein